MRKVQADFANADKDEVKVVYRAFVSLLYYRLGQFAVFFLVFCQH